MHVIMGVPLRVATATSNLMMGITASAGAIIYLLRGGIDPYARRADRDRRVHRGQHRLPGGASDRPRLLRGLFVVILLYTAWQMLQRASATSAGVHVPADPEGARLEACRSLAS